MINLKNLQLGTGDIMIEPGECYRVIEKQRIAGNILLSEASKTEQRNLQTHQYGKVIAMSKDVFDIMEERKANPKNNLPILKIGTTIIFTLGFCELWDIPIYEEISATNVDIDSNGTSTEKRKIKLPTTINHNNILGIIHE